MENLKGWDIDLKAVYGRHWKDRERLHPREDLWESPDGSTAVLMYRIFEAGLSKEAGRIAVFRDKKRPRLTLNVPWLEFWYLYDRTVQFGADGIIFVHRFRYGVSRLFISFCSIDPAAEKVAFLPEYAEKFCDIIHRSGTEYGISDMGKSGPWTFADISKLKWRPVKGLLAALASVTGL